MPGIAKTRSFRKMHDVVLANKNKDAGVFVAVFLQS